MRALLKVVCTDQGQHPERLLGRVNRARLRSGRFGQRLTVVEASGSYSRLTKGAAGGPPRDPDVGWRATVAGSVEKVVDGSTGGPRRVFQFTCSTCQRSPRVADDKLELVIAQGVSVLDISALPF